VAATTLWCIASLAALGYLGFVFLGKGGDRRLFLPGETTSAHYQIELECSACHAEPFAGAEQFQAACERCHQSELEASRDAHPKSKFTDPRNAARVANLDARRCVTCHREHWPEGTNAMATTLQQDYCYHCHADVGKERPSHAGLSHFSCAEAGCHNFHDNRALYEDFLVAHADEPDLLDTLGKALPRPLAPPRPLSAAEGDAPEGVRLPDEELSAWVESSHARAGVNCSGCHGEGGAFRESVSVETCGSCHEGERRGWGLGRHGMRVGLGLSPMTPGQARSPMHASVSSESLDCTSCHGAHRFDRVRAAVDACQGCHDDVHTRAYAESPHHATWLAALSGVAPPDSGVSCATCHLPRLDDERGRTFVEHNQNDNLRPSEKMIRGVCSNCHGLAFSIDALADPRLIRSNFNGRPERHVPSIDWAVLRSRTPPTGNSPNKGE